MGYYVPNKVKPVCYNCPYRTNKYCGLLTEHDYLGDYPFNFELYPYCPLIEVADRKTEPTGYKMKPVEQTEPQVDCSTCRFDDRYGDESICSMCTRHYSDFYQPKIKIELQTNAIDMALVECRVQHNGCKNCNKACVWRDEE